MEDLILFGEWVRRRRRALDLTQAALAARSSCALITVRKIESGDRKPSLDLARSLADGLGLLGEERRLFLEAARGVRSAAYLPPPGLQPNVPRPSSAPAAGSPAEVRLALPVAPTPIIGREVELEQIASLVAATRLVTLTGPGGTGKTRLALESGWMVLRDFPDGAVFVDLAPISDPDLVASAIGQALTVRAGGNRSLLQRLEDFLREKRLLLLLDNFEQVLPAATLVARLLEACPLLKILVTSRAPLRVRGEQEYPVPPLPLPDVRAVPPLHLLARNEAIRLFCQRASKPGFQLTEENAAAVAEVCSRLDGLPLAIELAAARTKILSPQAILARLDAPFDLLAGGARDLPERQQTLRSTIAWSYELLPPDERSLFRHLAVFVGGFTVGAAEAVYAETAGRPLDVVDGLASLVDISLVRQEEGSDGEQRFSMLETIRQYGLELLNARDEGRPVRDRHADYYLALSREAEPALQGPKQRAWLDRLEQEHANVRAALQWCIAGGRAQVGLALGAGLARFWAMHGHLAEGRSWLTQFLDLAVEADPAMYAKALYGAGFLSAALGDRSAAQDLLDRSLALRRTLGDARGVAEVLLELGQVAMYRGDNAAAQAQLEEALRLSRAMEDAGGSAAALYQLGLAAMVQRDYPAAQTAFQEGLGLYRSVGDQRGIAATLAGLGRVASRLGEYAQARSLLEESLPIMRELGDRSSVAVLLNTLGEGARAAGNLEEARRFYEESQAQYRLLGSKGGIAQTLHNLGYVTLAGNDTRHAFECFRESLLLAREIQNPRAVALCLTGLASVAACEGRVEKSARLFGAAEALFDTVGAGLEPLDLAERDRYMARARGIDAGALRQGLGQGRAMGPEDAVSLALAEPVS